MQQQQGLVRDKLLSDVKENHVFSVAFTPLFFVSIFNTFFCYGKEKKETSPGAKGLSAQPADVQVPTALSPAAVPAPAWQLAPCQGFMSAGVGGPPGHGSTPAAPPHWAVCPL